MRRCRATLVHLTPRYVAATSTLHHSVLFPLSSTTTLLSQFCLHLLTAMSGQTRPLSYAPSDHNCPSAPPPPPPRQTRKLFTAATRRLLLLLLSGSILTSTVVALIFATPLLVLFSPILVPDGLALFLLAAGFLFAGGCGVAAMAVLSWMYNCVAGKNPTRSDRLDYAGAIIADKARDMKERAKHYGLMQGMAQEVTYGS